MWIVLGSMLCSAVVSVVITRKLATHYFTIVNSYMEEICDKTNKNNEKTLAIIRKLQENFER